METYYRETSQRKPFYHSDLKKTLEGIVFEKPSEKKTDALERIFSDKTRTLKAGVKALLDEIETREELDQHLIGKIDGEIGQQRQSLLDLKMLEDGNYFTTVEEARSLKADVEDRLLNLEQEKRKEEMECWRDLMFLKKDLMVSLKEYWDLVKRGEVLGDRLHTGIKHYRYDLNKL